MLGVGLPAPDALPPGGPGLAGIAALPSRVSLRGQAPSHFQGDQTISARPLSPPSSLGVASRRSESPTAAQLGCRTAYRPPFTLLSLMLHLRLRCFSFGQPQYGSTPAPEVGRLQGWPKTPSPTRTPSGSHPPQLHPALAASAMRKPSASLRRHPSAAPSRQSPMTR